MDLGSLLLSYLALSGAHAGSHLSEANSTNAPARMNWGRGVEEWERPDAEYKFRHWESGDDGLPLSRIVQREDASKYGSSQYTGFPVSSVEEAKRNGAGFSGQDIVNSAMNTPESNLANALYKGLYLAGITAAGKNATYKGGDIGGVSENTKLSPREVKALIGLTVLADLYKSKNPEAKWNLQTNLGNDGLFGLKFNMPF